MCRPAKAGRYHGIVPALILLITTSQSATWTLYDAGVTARLRGLSAPTANIVWASGSEGTIVRTTDGGRTWQRLTIPDTQKLDFRDIEAFDDRTAYVLSIGDGDASRIFKTTDGGITWTRQFQNRDPKAFYDAMTFRDERRGFAFSDSVDGRFVILRTDDGGRTWNAIPTSVLPPALTGEGAYAASGSIITVAGSNVWVGTTASRVLRSTDGGATWSVFQTPIPASNSAGIFSIAFRDSTHGIAVGGDYKLEAEARDNAAVTADGGRTWTKVTGLGGFRSAVAYVAAQKTWVAVGPSGSDLSADDGRSWRRVDGPGFDSVRAAPGSVVWASGAKGAIGRLDVRRTR